ncbi:hypothetical protein KC19_VG149600 [Ceratodon purpureus]|uniref:Uncharacterized protein n=1 Tax=Ceratodon purpureus TaxID=3225 RepID=A0A8T0HRD3_CERPU|nr:hypothetical protein KC19_VG149600 [Ceratodon purpureus]
MSELFICNGRGSSIVTRILEVCLICISEEGYIISILASGRAQASKGSPSLSTSTSAPQSSNLSFLGHVCTYPPPPPVLFLSTKSTYLHFTNRLCFLNRHGLRLNLL